MVTKRAYALPDLWAYNVFFRKELRAVYYDGYQVVYQNLIDPLAALLRYRLKEKNQNTVLITGRTGSGKSTIGVQLCQAIDKTFDIERDYVYTAEDLKQKLKDPTSCPVSLLDEGSVSLNSYNSQRKDDKRLTILLDTARVLGKTNVICMPEMDDLNKRVRQNHIDFLLKCPVVSPIPGFDKRGFYTIYSHEYRDWGRDWWKPVGTSIFGPMEAQLAKRYDKIKLAHLMPLLEEFTEEEA